jgi:hypothetical protein
LDFRLLGYHGLTDLKYRKDINGITFGGKLLFGGK